MYEHQYGGSTPMLTPPHVMKRSHIHLIITASALVLSLVSFVVCFDGAAAEPYIVFRGWDAVVQVGVAMMLMLLWLQLAGGTIVGVVRRRVSAWWLLLLIWVFICELYLFESPSGYIEDITRYVAISH